MLASSALAQNYLGQTGVPLTAHAASGSPTIGRIEYAQVSRIRGPEG